MLLAAFAFALISNLTFGVTAAHAELDSVEGAVPGIWTDPDGCQHYALFNGLQGMMTPRMRPDGTMVCAHQAMATCLVLQADQLFAFDQSTISATARRRLQDFFRSNGSAAYGVAGHTDSVGSDAYNLGLSQRRARAVAAVARSVGANVVSVQGYGESQPRASNDTADGRQLNRRVEIQCSN